MPLKRKTSCLYNFAGTQVTFLETALSVSSAFSESTKGEGGHVPYVFLYVKNIFKVVQWTSAEFSFARLIWLCNLACVRYGFPIRIDYVCFCKHIEVGSLQSKGQRALVFLLSQSRTPCWSVLLWMKNEQWKSNLSFKH